MSRQAITLANIKMERQRQIDSLVLKINGKIEANAFDLFKHSKIEFSMDAASSHILDSALEVFQNKDLGYTAKRNYEGKEFDTWKNDYTITVSLKLDTVLSQIH